MTTDIKIKIRDMLDAEKEWSDGWASYHSSSTKWGNNWTEVKTAEMKAEEFNYYSATILKIANALHNNTLTKDKMEEIYWYWSANMQGWFKRMLSNAIADKELAGYSESYLYQLHKMLQEIYDSEQKHE